MHSRSALVVVLLVVLGLMLPAEAMAGFNVPAGFSDELVVGGVTDPTAIAWLPASENGDLLITTRGGALYRWRGSGAAEPILNLAGTICSGSETGLLGVAVHPEFGATDRFVYLYYTDRRGNGNCSNASTRANRVVRYPMASDGALLGEEVLIDTISARGGNHNGGDLQFGNDGLLYISAGDGGQDLFNGNGQDGNRNARRLDLLNGKILRIEPNGAIPPTNPFQGAGTARCAGTVEPQAESARVSAEKRGKNQGRRHKKRKRNRKHRRNPPPGPICREIFATGLRNPYRIAFDAGDTSDPQRLFINDVGGNGFEEINEGIVGQDYGWNIREGPCPINQPAGNCATDARFADPIFAYGHGNAPPDGCTVITGGAFPPGPPWPGDYLFADFGCNTLFALTEGGTGATFAEFATGTKATHLAFGPDGALYYTDFSTDEVRRIVAN